jgi:hypothetical protein
MVKNCMRKKLWQNQECKVMITDLDGIVWKEKVDNIGMVGRRHWHGLDRIF